MKSKSMRRHAKWISQVTAANSLILIAYVRGKYAFVFGNRAGSLLFIASLAALLTLVFGIPALPRWQGFVALAVFFFVAYCLLFVRMYVLACN